MRVLNIRLKLAPPEKLTKKDKGRERMGKERRKREIKRFPAKLRQKKSITKYSKLEQDAKCTFWGDSLKRAHFIGCKKGTSLWVLGN